MKGSILSKTIGITFIMAVIASNTAFATSLPASNDLGSSTRFELQPIRPMTLSNIYVCKLIGEGVVKNDGSVLIGAAINYSNLPTSTKSYTFEVRGYKTNDTLRVQDYGGNYDPKGRTEGTILNPNSGRGFMFTFTPTNTPESFIVTAKLGERNCKSLTIPAPKPTVVVPPPSSPSINVNGNISGSGAVTPGTAVRGADNATSDRNNSDTSGTINNTIIVERVEPLEATEEDRQAARELNLADEGKTIQSQPVRNQLAVNTKAAIPSNYILYGLLGFLAIVLSAIGYRIIRRGV